MLAVVKEPHIELSLSGASSEKLAEFLNLIRSRYTVIILTDQEDDDDEEYVDVFKTDYWKNVTPGDLLAGTRLKHELTQEQLAEKSGIHQVVISAYETGRRKLSRRAAIKLAKAMGEEPDSFFRNVEQQ
ncbi:MAG: helix-turn-helix transcriptional regulator [Lentisphaeria bacterium]|nr:helix-turn-helix transcriptional regulator [Lentisphaeria bacterium]